MQREASPLITISFQRSLSQQCAITTSMSGMDSGPTRGGPKREELCRPVKSIKLGCAHVANHILPPKLLSVHDATGRLLESLGGE